MKATGLILLLATILAPLYWFAPMLATHNTEAIISQYIGCAALIAMGMTQLMATRFRWLEILFGGLDRIYVIHKWTGITAIVAVLLHDTLDAEVKGLGGETALTDLAETMGEFSYYGLLVLVGITIATFIPYHWWRWTHKFMGAFFSLGAFHYIFMLKPFSVWDPLGLYVSAFCALGILCYLYTLLPFGFLHGRFAYRISEVQQNGDALAVSLEPEKSGLSHRAGQFTFIRFEGQNKSEVHPFTISKAPDASRSLRFTIKPLGDDTRHFASKLKAGDHASVSPAFGHFARTNGKRPEIWLAGGVGVTPFAAFAQTVTQDSAPIHFFYCTPSRQRASHVEEFEALAKANSNFHFHLIETESQGRLTADKIEAALDFPISKATAYFCGPEAMRESLKSGLRSKGLAARRFKYEEFEIRSGIGLEPVFKILLKLILAGFDRYQSRREARKAS